MPAQGLRPVVKSVPGSPGDSVCGGGVFEWWKEIEVWGCCRHGGEKPAQGVVLYSVTSAMTVAYQEWPGVFSVLRRHPGGRWGRPVGRGHPLIGVGGRHGNEGRSTSVAIVLFSECVAPELQRRRSTHGTEKQGGNL